MPLPEIPAFNFDLEKIREYARSHFDNFDSAIAYIEYVRREYEKIKKPQLEEVEKANEQYYQKYDSNEAYTSVSQEEISKDLDSLIEVGIKVIDYDDFKHELNTFEIELKRKKMEYSRNVDLLSSIIEANEELINKGDKIKWTDTNYLSLMAFFELLDTAGLIPDGSYKKIGAIASRHFCKKDGSPISRFGFNNKKDEYEEKKHDILGKLLDKLIDANKFLMDNR